MKEVGRAINPQWVDEREVGGKNVYQKVVGDRISIDVEFNVVCGSCEG